MPGMPVIAGMSIERWHRSCHKLEPSYFMALAVGRSFFLLDPNFFKEKVAGTKYAKRILQGQALY